MGTTHADYFRGDVPVTRPLGADVERARVLEVLARMDAIQRAVAPEAPVPAPYLIDKHFLCKHGKGAHYGQRHP